MEELKQETSKKMSYSTFSLEMVRKKFHLTLSLRPLFEDVAPIVPSEFLKTALHRASDLAVISEKARAEFIVAPLLLEVREVLQNTISIYSGVRFDVAPEEGLQGVCDFIITRTPPFPTIQTPLLVMVEAKRNIVEEGLGQCAAEMIAAQRVNQEESEGRKSVYGCVTTGEIWQFLQLNGQELVIDPAKMYIEHIDKILGILVKTGTPL
ncbi:MAG: hypothetical protein ACREEM_29415 [Blastocatellia bacterium]